MDEVFAAAGMNTNDISETEKNNFIDALKKNISSEIFNFSGLSQKKI
jgi:hypothetical protein